MKEPYNKPIRSIILVINFIMVVTLIVASLMAWLYMAREIGAVFIVWSLFAGWWFLDSVNSPFRKIWSYNKKNK